MTPSSTHNPNFESQLSSVSISITLLSELSHSQVVSNHSHLFFCVSKDIGSKHLSFTSLILEQGRSTFTSIQRIKRCHLETLLITVVVWELCIWQTLIPTITILKCTSSQHIFQNLVDPFSLSIGLRVVSRTEIYFVPKDLCTLCQNCDVNWVPLSDTIFLGTPCKHTILSIYNSASLAPV